MLEGVSKTFEQRPGGRPRVRASRAIRIVMITKGKGQYTMSTRHAKLMSLLSGVKVQSIQRPMNF